MSKLSRGKKGEASVSKTLKAVSKKHYVLEDVTFLDDKNEMSHQVDHILIHPYGIFVIETKNYYGTIEVDADGAWWKTIRGQKTRISNPLHQNKGHARLLRKILEARFDIIPVVVYAQNNAPYLPDENVINLEDLLLFIDSYPFSRELNEQETNSVKHSLEARISDVSAKEHVENIGILKAYRKEKEAEMAYAIERGICPRCGHKMSHEGYQYRCTNCDFKFSL